MTWYQRFKQQQEKGLNGNSNPDLCDAGALLHQLSYQANWEQVFTLVVNVEIDETLFVESRKARKFRKQ